MSAYIVIILLGLPVLVVFGILMSDILCGTRSQGSSWGMPSPPTPSNQIKKVIGGD